ncbi:MAG TPA: MBL fold metallo-hydrolase [Gemmatimonadaceae bacterium]|nr:MBL fold metallo-hydrolase [Gemmatimonadaceae bacterium]
MNFPPAPGRLASAILTLWLALAALPAEAQSWCDRPARAGYDALARVRVRDPWFHVYRVDDGVFAFHEPFNVQEVISWLIVGRSRALLFDTGMGMSRISAVVRELTRLPVTVVNSHSHYDHVGGNAEFGDVWAMATDYTRGNAAGIPHAKVAQEVRPDALCARALTTPFDTATYAIRPFHATGAVRDGSVIDLGGRRLEVLAIPGHTPDAMALLDRARGHLWTGDTFYPGPIWLHVPGTDLAAYDASMARLAALAPSLTRIFPAHNFPVASPSVLPRVLDAFRQVRAGAARHEPRGEGLVEYPFDGFSFLMRAPGKPLRVLFIGNSYTYYNNLPAIVADFARTGRYERAVTVEMVAQGGASLRDHWMSGEALAAIRRGTWDYVVLQEQSMLGVMLADGAPSVNDPDHFHAYARLFAREIAGAGATPVFYLTWARKATPALQQRLTSAYAAIARETGARLAPAGIAWQGVRAARPTLELYDPDGTHPSPAGSYLAAATLWATISGTPARGLASSANGRLLADSQRVRLTDSTGRLVALADSDATFIQRHVDQAMAEVPTLSVTPVPRDRLPPLPAGDPLTLEGLTGRWTGTMRLYDAPVEVELTVTSSARGADAVWRVRGTGWSAEQSLRDLSLHGAVLSFSVPDPRFLAPDERHRAVRSGDTLVGRAEVGSATQVPRLVGSWRLTRVGQRR